MGKCVDTDVLMYCICKRHCIDRCTDKMKRTCEITRAINETPSTDCIPKRYYEGLLDQFRELEKRTDHLADLCRQLMDITGGDDCK